MRRFACLLFLVCGFASSTANAAVCAGFGDVDTTATYCDAVTYVKNKGITIGCGSTGANYCPNDFVTRAQMALFLQRMGRGASNNGAIDYRNTQGGGEDNRANATFTTVGGGSGNHAEDNYATIGGGRGNEANGAVSTVGGGQVNGAGGDYAAITGGLFNIAIGNYAHIGGGKNNSAPAVAVVIAGGEANQASSPYATVGGGYTNAASGPYSTMGGGSGNTATGDYASVVGGTGQHATANRSFIGGGDGNLASGGWATIAGGTGNIASGYFGSVGGGDYNRASGYGSAVPGGRYNEASGATSFAAGTRATANLDGCFVWGDASTANPVTCGSVTKNQFVARTLGGVYFFTSGNTDSTYAGATLQPGSGSWTTYSDRAGKDEIVAVDPLDVLQKVVAMPVATWRYKPQTEGIKHIGPMAQDFYAAFGFGETDKGISTVDGQGVALAAIQGLNAKLEAENAELRARLTRIEALLAQ